MNIELKIMLDGEEFNLNDELNSVLNQLVHTYIKQKLTGIKPKEKKIKEPRDPNLPKPERKPHLTDMQKSEFIHIARDYQEKPISRAARIIADHHDRAFSSVYNVLKKAQEDGLLKFKEFDRTSFQVHNMERIKNAFANRQPSNEPSEASVVE